MQHRPALMVILQAGYEPAVVIETNHDRSGASTALVGTAFLCLGHATVRQEAFWESRNLIVCVMWKYYCMALRLCGWICRSS
jgi:hypothetical protein